MPSSAVKPVKLFKLISCSQSFRENVKVTSSNQSYEEFEMLVFYPTETEYTFIRTVRTLVLLCDLLVWPNDLMYSLIKLEKCLHLRSREF